MILVKLIFCFKYPYFNKFSKVYYTELSKYLDELYLQVFLAED